MFMSSDAVLSYFIRSGTFTGNRTQYSGSRGEKGRGGGGGGGGGGGLEV